MKSAVLVFHLICCAIFYLRVEAQFDNEMFNNIKRYIQQYRKAGYDRLNSFDNSVYTGHPGLRKLRRQVTGNNIHDFMDINEAMLDGEAMINMTAVLRAGGNPSRSSAGASTCVWNQALRTACDSNTKYRTPSGHCNNLRHKTYGMAGTPFVSRLPVKYQDDVQAPRLLSHYTKRHLPNARKVSMAITTTTNPKTRQFSSQIMQWGQFIAHEVTSIMDAQPNITCCPDALAEAMFNTKRPSQSQLREARELLQTVRGDICIAIENENDPVHGDVCMSQVRSGAVPNIDCSPSERLQMNTATHFVDASAVYGSSTSAMNKLRSMRGGKMKVQMVRGKELPPKEEENCRSQCKFAAGDIRINTTPNLIAIHTMFIKKHNQVCDQLAQMNPHWNDEKLFQEARRIVSAIQQNINFNEWLPNILGSTVTRKYQLTPYTGKGYRNTYNSNINPTLMNEFAGAAHRFGHTAVRGSFECGGSQELKDHFEKPDLIYRVGIDKCMAGLGMQTPGSYDKSFADDMRNLLLDEDQDIVTLNLNRGRDHGFQSYADYRRVYNLGHLTSWDSMRVSHTSDTINGFKRIYDDPRDVELFIGGISEKPISDGYVGPLFAELLGDGYRRLRDGDRHYFESETAGFTIDQVNAIREYTCANLICDVGDLDETTTDAFHLRGSQNPMLRCDRSPQLKMELWRDGPSSSQPHPSQSRPRPSQSRPRPSQSRPRPSQSRPRPSQSRPRPSPIQPRPSSNRPRPSLPVHSNCAWRTKLRSPCCNGRRTTVKECVGGRSCRPGYGRCSGSATSTESCRPTCPFWNRRCTSDAICHGAGTSDYSVIRCSWETSNTASCCRGYKTITRRCVGGSSCQAGSRGCQGNTRIKERCRTSCPSWDPDCQCQSSTSSVRRRTCVGRHCRQNRRPTRQQTDSRRRLRVLNFRRQPRTTYLNSYKY